MVFLAAGWVMLITTFVFLMRDYVKWERGKFNKCEKGKCTADSSKDTINVTKWCNAIEEISGEGLLIMDMCLRIKSAGSAAKEIFGRKCESTHILDMISHEDAPVFVEEMACVRRGKTGKWKTMLNGCLYGVMATQVGNEDVLMLLKKI